MRGGICISSKRLGISNNPYIPDSYDKTKPHNFIISIDANNLYGFSMSSYLPLKNFRWLNEEEIDNLDILNISDKNQIGYILEVDLEYQKFLHDLHDDLPLAPRHTNITIDELSSYQKFLIEKLDLKFQSNVKKLTPK